jgi:pilus assembly protein CpaF
VTPRHLDLVLARPELADLDPAQRRLAIRSLVTEAQVPDARRVAAELSDYVDGFGLLTPLMDDPRVTDVLVNGPGEVWVDRGGGPELTGVTFPSASELDGLVRALLGRSGRSADMACPIADAPLADGSRLHVVLPPVAPRGPLVSIRRFARRVMELDDLEAAGMMDAATHSSLASLVHERKNLVIAGATSTGKTTLMNALLMQVPRDERIVVLEETPELRLGQRHAVSLLARARNVEGAGEIDLTELLRAALRMRPDRIVVGEVRGAESLVALSAFSTGHEGSMVTVHARSPSEVAPRLVSLALQSPSAPSERALGDQVRSAFDAVVFVRRARGKRSVTAISPIA